MALYAPLRLNITNVAAQYEIPFEYLDKAHVTVTVDNIDVAFSWIGDTTITLVNQEGILGKLLEVGRRTQPDARLVRIEDTYQITAQELELDSKQAFYLAQESLSREAAALATALDGSYDAEGKRISQVGDPNSDDDAANQRYVLQILASGFNVNDERILAEIARAGAELAEDGAETQAAFAAQSVLDAAAKVALAEAEVVNAMDALASTVVARDVATTQASAASTSATSAQTAETSAIASANDSAQSATASASSATTATNHVLEYRQLNYGSLAANPTTRPDGSASVSGDVYYNTAELSLKFYNGSAWEGLQDAGAYTKAQTNARFAEITRPRENLIINGDFQVAQRGSSQTASGYRSVDRWKLVVFNNAGCVMARGQCSSNAERGLLGGQNYLSMQRTDSVTGRINTAHLVEGFERLSGKTVTLSFKARSSLSGKLGVLVGQSLGTDGSYHEVSKTVTQLSAEWDDYSITFTVPETHPGAVFGGNFTYTSYTYIELWIQNGNGAFDAQGLPNVQGGAFDFANAKLEIGDTATDFQRRSYGEELSLCQRYYQGNYNRGAFVMGDSTTCFGPRIEFTTAMRTSPSFQFANVAVTVDGGGVGVDAMVIDHVSNTGAAIFARTIGIVGGRSGGYGGYSWTADAELQ